MPLTSRSNASTLFGGPSWLLLAALLLAAALPAAGQEMTVEAYEPRSTLKVPGGPVTRAKFPFVDAHGHLRGAIRPGSTRWSRKWTR